MTVVGRFKRKSVRKFEHLNLKGSNFFMFFWGKIIFFCSRFKNFFWIVIIFGRVKFVIYTCQLIIISIIQINIHVLKNRSEIYNRIVEFWANFNCRKIRVDLFATGKFEECEELFKIRQSILFHPLGRFDRHSLKPGALLIREIPRGWFIQVLYSTTDYRYRSRGIPRGNVTAATKQSF